MSPSPPPAYKYSGSSSEPEAGDVLPLRLSVTQGGLGIELSRPHPLGGFVVEELEIDLPGVSFPVDLSRGVKQFRHHRGTLSRLSVRLDLEELSRHWEQSLQPSWGEQLHGVRVKAAPLEGPSQSSLGLLSVTFVGMTGALVFDLVLAPGNVPRFIVDSARGLGLDQPPLPLALRMLENALPDTLGAVSRRGRAIEIGGMARFLCLTLLPSLGFRVPVIPRHVVHRATHERGQFLLSLSAEGEPCGSSARAVRLSGLSDLCRRADDLLASGQSDEARERFLQLLEQAPGHAELLTTVAEIDAYSEGRSESALSLLEERRSGAPVETEFQAAWLRLQALQRTLRTELWREAAHVALELEPDSALRSLLYCELSQSEPDQRASVEALDAAIASFPSHPRPRWMRLEKSLALGDLATAKLDAQQLDAMSSDLRVRAQTASRLGDLFLSSGSISHALIWLKRALRESPDDTAIKLRLGQAYEQIGRNLDAAEFYQAALNPRRADVEPPLDAELEKARLSLGRIVAEDVKDESLAIAYLKEIGSRSVHALAARTLEAELARRLGDSAARRSALLRLLESIELGWVVPHEPESLLSRLERELREEGQSDLADFALRLLPRSEPSGQEPQS